MEKLIISNFVGIKEIEIELARINILIGPQATGKSICAKLSYFFKGFVGELFAAVENEKTERELDVSVKKKFADCFPPSTWGETTFRIRYAINDCFIQLSRDDPEKTTLHLEYSEFFKEELKNLQRNFHEKLREQEEDYDRAGAFRKARTVSRKNIQEHLGAFAGSSRVFIPAGRSFFANLQNSIFSFLSANKDIDPFLTEFGSFYESVKRRSVSRELSDDADREFEKQIDILIEKILCGRYVREKNREYLIAPDNRRTGLANISSGQQEMLPLAIILRFISFVNRRDFGYTAYIEEPEAHLFPSAQRTIVELIATIFNNSGTPLQFFITTHSPYILTSLNNLIHAGALYEKLPEDKKETLTGIVRQEQQLNINEIRVYSLDGGTCQEMQCDDSGLIPADLIDTVSDDLALQFDELLSLE